MRGDTTRPLAGVLGAALVVAGYFYPGEDGNVVMTLIAAGTGFLWVAVVLRGVRSFEFGPLKTTLAEDYLVGPHFHVADMNLDRFACMMLGDVELGRVSVENALIKAGRQRRRLPADQRDAFIMRSLVQIMETADDRHWLLGRDEKARDRGPARSWRLRRRPALSAGNTDAIVTLQKLDFPARLAYLLRTEGALSLTDIAVLLERPSEEIARAYDRAQERIGSEMRSGDEVNNA